MSFVSENGSRLRGETFIYNLHGRMQSSPQSVIYRNTGMVNNRLSRNTQLLRYDASFVSMVVIAPDGCGVFIDTESKFSILTKVSSEIADNISKVTLRYVQ